MKGAALLFAILTLCFGGVMWLGGYYYHLNHLKPTDPRPVFRCETHIELDEFNNPVQIRSLYCKRNPLSITF